MASDVDCQKQNDCINEQPEFSMVPNQWMELNSNEEGILRLKNAAQFDFEQDKGPFRMEVIALDRGVSRDRYERTQTLPVYLSVTDYPDEPPKFERSQYFFQMSENPQFDYEIGRVTAHDGDIDIGWSIQSEFRII